MNNNKDKDKKDIMKRRMKMVTVCAASAQIVNIFAPFVSHAASPEPRAEVIAASQNSSSSVNGLSYSLFSTTYPNLLHYLPLFSGVPLDVNLELVFDKPVQLGNGDILIRKLLDNTVAQTFHISGGGIQGAVAIISGGSVVLNPNEDLAGATSYYVQVSNGAFESLSGTAFSGTQSGQWVFTTDVVVDITAPSMVWVSPKNTDASLTNPLVIQFNEPVRFKDGDIRLYKQGVSTPVLDMRVSGAYHGDRAWISGSTVVINPNFKLDENTSYYVQITSGAITDYAGNAYGGFADTTTWDFTTENRFPQLERFGPLTSGASVDTNLFMEFSEPVKLGNGDVTIRRQRDSAVAQSFHISGGVIQGAVATISGGSVTLDPNAALADGTNYYVEVSNGAFKDLTDLAFSGTHSGQWMFSTAVAADITAPSMVGVSPKNTGASLTAPLVIRFNEPVRFKNGEIRLYKQGVTTPVLDMRVSGAYHGDRAWISGSTVVINPNFKLDENTSYYVQITSGAITDYAGNAYGGFADTTTWDFTTENRFPQLERFGPLTSGASVDTNLFMEFSEPVKLGNGDVTIRRQRDSAIAQSFHISGGVIQGAVATISGGSVTLDPNAALADGTNYYVEVSNGAFKDLTDLAFSGTHSGQWMFSTAVAADITAPSMVGVSPKNTGASLTAPLVIRFNEPVRFKNGEIRLYKQGVTTPVLDMRVSGAYHGDRAWISGSTVVINPNFKLDENTSYYVQITSGAITDYAGNAYGGFADTTTWDFTTENRFPQLERFGPLSSGASVDTNLFMEFSEPVKLGYGDVIIRRQRDKAVAQSFHISGGVIQGAVAIISGGSVVLDPNQDLADGTSYYVEVSNGAFKDLTNLAFSGTHSGQWIFAIADMTAPSMVGVSPKNTGASLTNPLVIQFNEPVRFKNGDIRLYKQGVTIPVLDMRVSGAYHGDRAWISGSTVVINPNFTLDANTSYYVQITSGAITDYAGNAYGGFVDTTTWDFTTISTTFNWGSSPIINIDTSQPTTPKPPEVLKNENISVVVQPFKSEEGSSIKIPVDSKLSDHTMIFYYDELYLKWIALPTKISGKLLTAEAPPGSWVAVIEDSNIFQPTDTVTNWANKDIIKLMSLGVLNGVNDNTFKPEDETTRYQIAVVFAKALHLNLDTIDSSAIENKGDFKDVPEWARKFVAAVLQNGLMVGSSGDFNGTQTVTRAQMATIIGRILTTSEIIDTKPLSQFSDASSIPKWAMDGVQKAIDLGILQGYPDSSFKPNETVTRAEMAAIVSRLMDFMQKGNV